MATQSKDVLSGWKEIAAYLGQGVRTVQRYERLLNLPIHRPVPGQRGTVMAIKSELDDWVSRPREGEQQATPQTNDSQTVAVNDDMHSFFRSTLTRPARYQAAEQRFNDAKQRYDRAEQRFNLAETMRGVSREMHRQSIELRDHAEATKQNIFRTREVLETTYD